MPAIKLFNFTNRVKIASCFSGSMACFAEIGVNVTCVDTNKEKIESLQKGNIPIYENGLEEMVLRNMKAKRLKFTTSLESCLDEVEVIFSAVGTRLVLFDIPYFQTLSQK